MEKENNLSSKTHIQVAKKDGSLLKKYQDVVVGSRSIMYTLYYEWCTYLSIVPGAAGIFLRKFFWPRLFRSCGKGVFFGTGIILRHPNKIRLGNRVVIGEGSILDARNPDKEEAIVLGDDGILSTNVRIVCKNGLVSIGACFGIGAQSIIKSSQDEPVLIGRDVLIGPQCYITGGSNHNIDRLDIPIWRQGMRVMGGTTLKDDIWIGAKVVVLGGLTIGAGSVIAAGSIVTKDIPPLSICKGTPAKVFKKRNENDNDEQASNDP